MPRVYFTPHLTKHLECPSYEVAGSTLGEALGQVFAKNPRLAGYILDDQGRVRQHVMIFIDNAMATDKVTLADPVAEASEIYVMQALSGG